MKCVVFSWNLWIFHLDRIYWWLLSILLVFSFAGNLWLSLSCVFVRPYIGSNYSQWQWVTYLQWIQNKNKLKIKVNSIVALQFPFEIGLTIIYFLGLVPFYCRVLGPKYTWYSYLVQSDCWEWLQHLAVSVLQ